MKTTTADTFFTVQNFLSLAVYVSLLTIAVLMR